MPLVAQMLDDPGFSLQPRTVDMDWYYHGVLPAPVVGFNPHTRAVLYAKKSSFASWLSAARRSARPYNHGDHLVHEVLQATHDYLHCWGFAVVCELHPELGFGTRPLTKRAIEDFVYCHMIIEAAAVVGLEYWYLCTLDLNDVCDVGTCVRGITVGYREECLAEYRKYCPDLDVQTKQFFVDFCEFYLTSRWRGFAREGLSRSAKLLAWLGHELDYEVKQRSLGRQWLSYLADPPIQYDPRELTAMAVADAAWKRRLVNEFADLLWEKVKDDRVHAFGRPLPRRELWSAPSDRVPDFRFTNLACLSAAEADAISDRRLSRESFLYLFHQLVSSFEYRRFDKELIKLFDHLVDRQDLALCRHLFRGQPRLAPADREPRDLFLPG